MKSMKDGVRRVRASGLLAALAVAASLGVGSAAWSAIRYVDNNSADGNNPPAGSTVYTTIQAGVDAAANGDTVKVYPGTYTSSAAEVVNLKGKLIVLEGNVANPESVVIDGQDTRRCIVATLNETSDTIVRGFKIWRGRASAGAGMYVVNGDPRIEDCRFISNVATGGVASGGGLRLLNSASVIHECYFDNNSADAEGGGIFNANGPLMITSCEFVNNRAPRGGGYFTRDDESTLTGCVFRDCAVIVSGWAGLGMYALNSQASISNSRFENLKYTTNCCSNDNYGAGLQVIGASADVRVVSCQFIGNGADGYYGSARGGAISIGRPGDNRGSIRIFKSVFRGNFARLDGGAIAMQSIDRLEIDGADGVPTIFENNSANRYGGAISFNVDWVADGVLQLDECRFVNNAAGASGGAIWIRQTGGSGLRTLTDSVFITNSAANGGGLFLEGTNTRSQLGRTVYCGNDPNDIQGAYLESADNCFTTSCNDGNSNGYPDTCEIPIVDCNGNSVPDDEELTDNDANNDLIPDDCQKRFLDFVGLESELVPIVGAGTSGAPGTAALCWRVYAKTVNPTASVICVYGNAERPFTISASGGLYQNGSGGTTVESISCTASGSVLRDSYFTIEATCNAQIELLTTIGFPNFDGSGNFSTNNGAYYVTPGAAGSQAGADNRILLMQLTTNQAIKPTASINLLGRHGVPDPEDGWYEWQAYGLGIPDPILVDCNGNGVHDSIEIATGAALDADRNGLPDACQECRGDVDGNGVVNIDDLIEIFIAWGDPFPGEADLNNDGTVNGGDLSLVLQGWGTCLAP
jgi:predicted outer membrane repeat protein